MSDWNNDDEKRFYERFWNLHNDAMLLRVFERFGTEPFRRSCVLENFAPFLSVNGFNGDTCVEIGSYAGLTALVLARHFKRVVSFDVLRMSLKRQIAEELGVRNVEFIDVANNETKYRFIAEMQFDAAFVDGNHRDDTQTDFDAVKRCGRVLFHEAWESQRPVYELLKSLSGDTRATIVTSEKFALWLYR